MVGFSIRSTPLREPSYGLGLLLAMGVYFVLAKAGLEAASLHASASPVWPATGLALALVLLWGDRMALAILLGAFLANLTTAGSLFTATATAIGNTLEAVIVAWILREWSGGIATFETPERVFRFAAACAFSGTAVSATFGVGSLAIAGYAEWSQFAVIWTTWWLGNMGGALLATPAIVLWATQTADLRQSRDLASTMAVLALAVAVGIAAFSPLLEKSGYRGLLALLAIVPLVWAGGRGSQRDTITVALILSAFAVWGVTADRGLVTTDTLNGTFLLLVAFILSVTIPSLALSAHVTERRRSEEALGARTRELETLLSTVPVTVWIAHDPEARVITGNRRAAETLQLPLGANQSLSAPEPARPQHFGVFKDGKELQPEELPVQRAARGEEIRDEIVETIFDDGSSRWLVVNASPIRDARGKPAGAVAAAVDITERIDSEARLKLLTAELDHRTKNMLAKLQTIVTLTLGTGPQTDAVLGRIQALARAHDRWKQSLDGMTLRQLVEEKLEPFASSEAVSRFSAKGPEIKLSPEATEQLSLGFYELVTNAVKHGSLSVLSGRVDVSWEVETDGKLLIVWRESGGPPVKDPEHAGFGTTVIRRALNAELAFAPPGLICRTRLGASSWCLGR